MSNTFDFGGCFGRKGCAAWREWHQQEGTATRSSRGWGVSVMQWVNSVWPHRQHEFYNRAAGASNPSLATHCLASHLAPDTDILLVDYDLSGWKRPQQEWLAR
eukprot:7059568-Prymnesium_polylepis.1